MVVVYLIYFTVLFVIYLLFIQLWMNVQFCCCRLGSSELCLQLVDLLYQVLTCWPAWDWHRPEYVYVSWTLSRLTPLLSNNHLQMFQSRLTSRTVLATQLSTFLNTALCDDGVLQLKSIVSISMKLICP